MGVASPKTMGLRILGQNGLRGPGSAMVVVGAGGSPGSHAVASSWVKCPATTSKKRGKFRSCSWPPPKSRAYPQTEAKTMAASAKHHRAQMPI